MEDSERTTSNPDDTVIEERSLADHAGTIIQGVELGAGTTFGVALVNQGLKKVGSVFGDTPDDPAKTIILPNDPQRD